MPEMFRLRVAADPAEPYGIQTQITEISAQFPDDPAADAPALQRRVCHKEADKSGLCGRVRYSRPKRSANAYFIKTS